MTVLVARIEPLRTDHRQKNLTLTDRCIEDRSEVHTQGNVVYVSKYSLIAKLLTQEIVNVARDVSRIVTAIRDKNLVGHGRS